MVIKIAWDRRILGLNIKENNPLLSSQVNDSKSATPIKIYKVVKKPYVMLTILRFLQFLYF